MLKLHQKEYFVQDGKVRLRSVCGQDPEWAKKLIFAEVHTEVTCKTCLRHLKLKQQTLRAGIASGFLTEDEMAQAVDEIRVQQVMDA